MLIIGTYNAHKMSVKFAESGAQAVVVGTWRGLKSSSKVNVLEWRLKGLTRVYFALSLYIVVAF